MSKSPHLFLFSEGYQMAKEGLEKKKIYIYHAILKTIGESPTLTLNLSPFFKNLESHLSSQWLRCIKKRIVESLDHVCLSVQYVEDAMHFVIFGDDDRWPQSI